MCVCVCAPCEGCDDPAAAVEGVVAVVEPWWVVPRVVARVVVVVVQFMFVESMPHSTVSSSSWPTAHTHG